MFGGQQVQPVQQRGQGSQQLQLFDGGRDPFGAFDDMMMEPFGSRLGGGLFGNMFGRMNQAMQELDVVARGPGGQVSMADGGHAGGMLFRGTGAGGGGGYSCQTMVFSATRGQDGQVHTERFTSSSVGDLNRQAREVQQAYSNSSTGIDKMSLERQLQGRGRKMVKELCRQTGEERNTDLYKGMSEEHFPQFDQQWRTQAAPYLPAHPAGGLLALGGGTSFFGQQPLAGGTAGPGMLTYGQGPQVREHQAALPPPAPQSWW
eukprot:CAMPEP_0179104140 /NCGR_PEP_ID=MMETSP0796-20121207/48291_1 /TAXON_ID=73915 /ORGANISM="Pyrodinium bahamense, Strain pbaha01" /LENGTH=260 /DNA_ID=CAMNT_0020802071 /DNA_START=70 /DNA_END=849 /DNA_ORIENTATION=+